MDSLEARRAERAVRDWCSFWTEERAHCRAWCWARRGGRREALWVMLVWRVWVRVRERVRRTASFWGLGGMGGAGMSEG